MLAIKVQLDKERSTAYILRRLNSLGYAPSRLNLYMSSLFELFSVKTAWVSVDKAKKKIKLCLNVDTHVKPVDPQELIKIIEKELK